MSIFGKHNEEELEEKKQQIKDVEEEKRLSSKLSDLDQVYKEGLTTLKDILAPAALKFDSASFELNGRLGRSFFVLAYPRFLSSNWLSLFNLKVR
jgi:hypothetical protein